jgi:hypothetical protein
MTNRNVTKLFYSTIGEAVPNMFLIYSRMLGEVLGRKERRKEEVGAGKSNLQQLTFLNLLSTHPKMDECELYCSAGALSTP